MQYDRNFASRFITRSTYIERLRLKALSSRHGTNSAQGAHSTTCSDRLVHSRESCVILAPCHRPAWLSMRGGSQFRPRATQQACNNIVVHHRLEISDRALRTRALASQRTVCSLPNGRGG